MTNLRFFSGLLISLLMTLQVHAIDCAGSARSFIAHKPLARDIQFDTGKSLIRGFQFKNDGPSIIAIHGFSGDASNFNPLGTFLHKNGYNFIGLNALGHGHGAHKSLAKLDIASEASVRRMVVEDLLLVIKEEYERTGEKIILMGHSLGAMTMDSFNVGAVLKESGYDISKRRLKEISKYVEAVVPIAPPTKFDYFKPEESPKIMAKLMDFLHKNLEKKGLKLSMEVASKNNPLSPKEYKGLFNSLTEVAKEAFLQRAALFIKENFPDNMDIMNIHNLTLEEIRTFIEYGSTGMHTKQMSELSSMMRAERFVFGQKDLGESYTHAVRTLYITGDQDRVVTMMAPNNTELPTLADDALARAKKMGSRSITVTNTSHLDILSFNAIEDYGPQLLKFLKGNRMPKHQTIESLPIKVKGNLKKIETLTDPELIDDLLIENKIILKTDVDLLDHQDRAIDLLTKGGRIDLEKAINSNVHLNAWWMSDWALYGKEYLREQALFKYFPKLSRISLNDRRKLNATHKAAKLFKKGKSKNELILVLEKAGWSKFQIIFILKSGLIGRSV